MKGACHPQIIQKEAGLQLWSPASSGFILRSPTSPAMPLKPDYRSPTMVTSQFGFYFKISNITNNAIETRFPNQDWCVLEQRWLKRNETAKAAGTEETLASGEVTKGCGHPDNDSWWIITTNCQWAFEPQRWQVRFEPRTIHLSSRPQRNFM